jgi:tRNA dimethylallyltransferase
VLGPTASGKTALAVSLAEHLKTHILSADSRQFYRELRIGSAMPTREELSRAPHHFIGQLSVRDDYNVSRFEQEALQCLNQLFGKHPQILLCGGSGLYLDAVCQGIDTLPDPDPELRAQLKLRLVREGLAALQFDLKRLDPDYYARADIQNPARVIRALEVCLTTGTTYSSLRRNKPVQRPFRLRKIGLDPGRQILEERISARTDSMLRDGLVEEARSLLPFRHLNALNTVGYKEIFAYLDGDLSMEEARDKICINTRRYAKRQMTWFRRDPEITWFPSNDPAPVMDALFS